MNNASDTTCLANSVDEVELVISSLTIFCLRLDGREHGDVASHHLGRDGHLRKSDEVAAADAEPGAHVAPIGQLVGADLVAPEFDTELRCRFQQLRHEPAIGLGSRLLRVRCDELIELVWCQCRTCDAV